jgi:hypothetical protein
VALAGACLALSLVIRPGRGEEGAVTNRNLQIGVFSGGYNIEKARSFDLWQGRISAFNVEFIDFSSSCALMGYGWGVGQWLTKGVPERNNMLFSVPLGVAQLKKNPNAYGGNFTNVLDAIAGGACDADYGKLARRIAASYPSAIIRIGWEFNGDWYLWQSAGREGDFVRAFRHVAMLFKAVSPHFVVDWCVASGDHPYHKPTVALSYPGDDVVDEIGLDVYDWPDKYAGPNQPDNQQNAVAHWNNFRQLPWSLDWADRFAASHHKPIAFPEWATGAANKGLKDGIVTAYFMKSMYAWMVTHNVVREAYWNSKSGYPSDLQDHPLMAAAYLETFAKYPFHP